MNELDALQERLNKARGTATTTMPAAPPPSPGLDALQQRLQAAQGGPPPAQPTVGGPQGLAPLDEASMAYGRGAELPAGTATMPYGEQMAKVGRFADDVVRGLANGATMGGADRISAALPGGAGSLPAERAASAAARGRVGVGPEIAGAIGGAMATAPFMPSTYLPALAGGANLAARVGAGAAEGAAMGAAGGAINSDQGASPGKEALTGALVGGAVPAAAIAARRLVTPFSGRNNLTQEQERLLAVADREGIPLPAGARTGNRMLKWADAVTEDFPAGQRAKEATQAAYNSAAGRRAGIPNATELDPATLEGAAARIGQRMDSLVSQTRPRVDQQFVTDLRDMVDQYRVVLPSERNAQIGNILSDLWRHAQQNGGAINPRVYQNTRSRLSSIADSATDPDFARAGAALRNALDDLAERSMPQRLRGEWGDARGQYRNLMRIREAMAQGGEAAAAGNLPPTALNQAVKSKAGAANYAVGRGGDLEDLGRIGSTFLRSMPNSGTAQRGAALAGAAGVGTGLAGMVAGQTDPSTALLLAAGGISPLAMGSLYRSRLGQLYATNRLLPGAAQAGANTAGRAGVMAEPGLLSEDKRKQRGR